MQTVESLHPVLCTCLLTENMDKNSCAPSAKKTKRGGDFATAAPDFRVNSSLSLMVSDEGAITQPESRCPGGGQRQVTRREPEATPESRSSVPPFAGMDPSGAAEPPLLRDEGGRRPLEGFVNAACAPLSATLSEGNIQLGQDEIRLLPWLLPVCFFLSLPKV